MSGKLVGKVLKLKLERIERDVLIVLAEACRNENGEGVSMRVEEIAHILGCSDRQVQRAQASLKAKGVLVDQNAPRNKPTVWNIDVTNAPQNEPYHTRKRKPQGDVVSLEAVTEQGDTNEREDVRVTPVSGVTSLPSSSAEQGDIASRDLTGHTVSTVKEEKKENAGGRDPRAYDLIRAYLAAVPENNRPGGLLTTDHVYQRAKQLIDQGCLPGDAGALTREKFLAGKTKYPFNWMADDLPDYSLKRLQPLGDPTDRGSLAFILSTVQQ